MKDVVNFLKEMKRDQGAQTKTVNQMKANQETQNKALNQRLELQEKANAARDKQVDLTANVSSVLTGILPPKLQVRTAVEHSHQLEKEEREVEIYSASFGKPPWSQLVEILLDVIDSKLRPSLESPPMVEMKELPKHLKYVFLGDNNTLPAIIASNLEESQEKALMEVLKEHKSAIGWTIAELKRISPSIVIHKIITDPEVKPAHDAQRRLNPNMREVVKKEVLKRCVEMNPVLSWEKSHFMVQEGTILGHVISSKGVEVDQAKVNVISNLPPPINVKESDHFWDMPDFTNDCLNAFNVFKNKFVETPAFQSPEWSLPFEIMCDASDYAVGAVLGQQVDKKPASIYYASKTLSDAQINYTTTEKELLAVVYTMDKFRSYICGSKVIVFSDYNPVKYLMEKKDAK
ncbi:uncharacterized protein LOC143551355 [Bidens hawaiensis]|uniref:uncharacterized protein LOC143551355 n=1 Tax=Bidens hawaiensis TaxID=980011 RepID=UPI00404B9BE2